MTRIKRPTRKNSLHEPPAAYGGPGGEVVLYQDPDGQVRLDVRLERETLWLNLNQIAALFERDKSVISRHLRNIYAEGELDKKATVAFFATVQKEGSREVVRQVEYYNLDAIISVGYRVNSRRGTQFRIWATQVIKDHILKGYTVNERRLAQLRQTIRLIADVSHRRSLAGDEAAALLDLLRDYSFALNLLDDYDHGRLQPPKGAVREAQPMTPEEARRLIAALRERWQAGPLFGQEKDAGLESALAAVFQTVLGRDAYPTIEDKAAHLLYFLVKNHPFTDGNKRIGAALFLWFLEKNHALYGANGERRISEEALVALTLLMAESEPRDREAIIQTTALLLHGRDAAEAQR